MAQTTERFWAKVEKTDGCWLWTASKLPKGYGRFAIHRVVHLAHRVSWEMANGPIPDGMHVDHTCYTPECVRPDHLRLVTPKQNIENRSGSQKNNRSGVIGVSRNRQSWRARVKHNRTEYHLGTFQTLDEAKAAVVAARNRLFTHNDKDRVSGS